MWRFISDYHNFQSEFHGALDTVHCLSLDIHTHMCRSDYTENEQHI